jgi:catechol 2,3-dioxygenase-like lactoylglutathione lyase family enzyme
MKRFHVHVSVEDLDTNIRFYSTVFGAPPTVRKADYAKWMMEDPRVNFAISRRGAKAGVDHLGLQVESDEALDQTGAACCYAKSDKYWITDPQGIAWETFHTLDSVPVFGDDNRTAPTAQADAACCTPGATPVRIPVKAAGGSCCS